MNWLTDFTNWLKEQITEFWNNLVEFFNDLLIRFFEIALDLAARAIESVPVPGFLETTSINTMLGQAGPVIAWCITTFRIAEGMALISTALAFRILRKILTLGQW